ncbi:MAG: ABC transporter permease subunit [Vicinamibacterales bacterium]
MTAGAPHRVGAILRKEMAELRAAKGVLLAPLAMLLVSVAIPVFVSTVLPAWTGERLDGDTDVVALARGAQVPGGARLGDAAVVQAFLLHQFLPLLALVPIVGGMALVTTSIVGEKQARTLEPLLATPITSGELLVAKIGAAFGVALTLGALGFAVLAGAAAVAGLPGVVGTLVSPRPIALVALVAPAATLVALTLGAIVSTRAKDARSAQQIGVVVVLPFVLVFLAGLDGDVALTTPALVGAAAGLLAAAGALGAVAVALFDRERVLTDWT